MTKNKCPVCGEVHAKIRVGVDHLSVGCDEFLIAANTHEAFAAHAGLAVDELLCLRRQLSAANAAREKAEMERDEAVRYVFCGFCGHKVDRHDEKWRDQLSEHIQACDKHPIKWATDKADELEAQNKAIRAAVDATMDKVRGVEAERDAALAELARLREMVDRLCRHTKDGAQVLPNENGEYPVLWYVAQGGDVLCHEPWREIDIQTMYSTREAAEAARKEGAR